MKWTSVCFRHSSFKVTGSEARVGRRRQEGDQRSVGRAGRSEGTWGWSLKAPGAPESSPRGSRSGQVFSPPRWNAAFARASDPEFYLVGSRPLRTGLRHPELAPRRSRTNVYRSFCKNDESYVDRRSPLGYVYYLC